MNFKRTLFSAATVLAGSLTIAVGAAQAAPAPIAEAGSTLVYPLVVDWTNDYNVYTGGTVTAAAVGSGAGITDVCGGTAQIGASDAPLGYPGVKPCGDGSMATMANYAEIPWALTATVPLYHIPGVKSGLRLSATDLAKIYTGKITNWDQLQKEQVVTVVKHGKKVKKTLFRLPNLKITPVYRSDGSGDSYAFTNFLTRGAHSSWKYGPNTTFPTSANASSIGSNGNSGVTNSVLATNGAIGYVSLYYTLSALHGNKNLGVAAVENAAKQYELANTVNIANAAASVPKPGAQNSASSTRPFGMVIQYPGKRYKIAYPISTYTYAIVPRSAGAKASPIKDFLTYAVSARYSGHPGGLDVGTDLGFVPLTKTVQRYDLSVIKGDIK